jgi:hypothetical protein
MRDLDAWVAERVIGNRVTGAPSALLVETLYETNDRMESLMMPSQRLKNYTTDPAAAMQVLEKCHEQCCVETGLFENISGSKRGHFARSVYKDVESEAETLSLAICHFAKQLFSK